MLIPYKFKNPRTLQRSDHHCPSLCMKKIICLDESGKRYVLLNCFHVLILPSREGYQHAVSVSTCSCEPEAVTLARFRMWPSTPSKPTLAFHHDLLLWMESITLEGCIGADAFCRALQCRVGSMISQQVWLICSSCMNTWLTHAHAMRTQFCQIYPAVIDAFEEFRYRLSVIKLSSKCVHVEY